MSQQGERHTGRPAQGDDWWGKLYDNEAAAEDTGPTPTPDTLDDRFTSAGAVAAPRAPGDSEAEPGPQAPPEPCHAVYPQTRHVWDTAPAQEPPRPAETSAPRPPVEPPRDTAEPPSADAPPPPSEVPRAEAAPPPPSEVPRAEAASPPPETSRAEAAPPPLWEAPRAEAAPSLPSEAPCAEVAPSPPPETPRAEAAPPPPDVPPTTPAPPLPDAPPAPPVAPSEEAAPPSPTAPPSVAAGPGAVPPLPEAPRGEAPAPVQPPHVDYVGDGPPTYDAEPTALPLADPEDLDDLVADTVLDGARCGVSTLRAASVRGDSARYRGEPRRDSLLTARFGSGPGALILVAMATGARATPGAHRAAAEVCEWIGRAVGLSHTRLAEDVRAGRRGDLKSGLHRLTDRSLGKLRASATEQGLDPEEYAATLRCLLLPADPACRTRVFFGVGGGGLFRLRDGEWRDIEPSVAEQSGAPVVGFGSSPPAETPDGDRLTMDLSITTPPSPYEPAPPPPRDAFRFRASVARPGDTLLLCSPGLAEPLRGEPDLARHLANRWADADPPGLAAFLADTQVRVKGYADDRTAAAVWEA
ncbi:protein phosphatase 2C domain-containing protein [Streptomyces sp. BH104]|uniref:protein phosphatase 2C domain-containing protein n=1 Tax=Streptomyces sp. BH104 TaxID=3410407 RepID=UPI003BB800B0